MFLMSLVYVSVGEVFISPLSEWTTFEQQLIFQLRLPRLLSAIVIGAALALSGAVLQVLLGNVLAEPGVLGISGGASVAMALLLIFVPSFATAGWLMLAAIIGALLFTLILISIAKTMRLTTSRLLLVGVALGILSSSILTWFFYFSDDFNLRQLMYWLMGSIGGASWYQHILTLIMLPVMIWMCLQGGTLDKLMTGELHAQQMGVDVDKNRWKLIVAIAVLVGGAVALGGVIGFVGLVVPHLVRLMFGCENRYLLPLSTFAGASLVLISDLIARMALNAAELPLGVVTTTIGAPYLSGCWCVIMIQVKNLSVLERLQPLSFQVEAGEVLHVVGPNGSGKSTLLAAMAGFALIFQGKLLIGRSDIKGLSLSQLASLRAYLTQFQRPVFNLGIAQYLALSIPSCASLSHSQTQAVIEELTTVLNIDDKLQRYIHQLSGGEWQRVRLCAACLQVWPSLNPDARFLVLDEPASSLDVGQEALLFALIERAAFSDSVL